MCSPQKSVLRGKRQSNIPKETVPEVVRNGLHLRPHPLRAAQHTKPVDMSDVHKNMANDNTI